MVFLFQGGSAYDKIEKLFYVFLIALTVSLLGVAAWSGPHLGDMLQGLLLFSSPPAQKGEFSVLLVVVSLIGAIGGSIGNMMYPFFITEKGWVGPRYRKVQMHDLAFGCTTIVLLDLAVWTIGAEVIYPTGKSITGLDDLT